MAEWIWKVMQRTDFPFQGKSVLLLLTKLVSPPQCAALEIKDA